MSLLQARGFLSAPPRRSERREARFSTAIQHCPVLYDVWLEFACRLPSPRPELALCGHVEFFAELGSNDCSSWPQRAPSQASLEEWSLAMCGSARRHSLPMK